MEQIDIQSEEPSLLISFGNSVNQSEQTFSIKDKTINTLVFMGYTVSHNYSALPLYNHCIAQYKKRMCTLVFQPSMDTKMFHIILMYHEIKFFQPFKNVKIIIYSHHTKTGDRQEGFGSP